MEKSIATISLFAALIAALGQMPAIALGFGVPITAQTLGVMLAGTVLGARRGALAALLVVVLAAIGLPVLSGGSGGLGVFAGPTVGFLIGWPFAAFATGWIVERWRGAPLGLVAGIASAIGGIGVLYPFGIVGLSAVIGKSPMETAALVLVFAPGDLAKATIAGLLTAALARARPASILSRPQG